MSSEATENFETFESFDEGSGDMESFDNMGDEETEKPVKETVKDDLKPIKDSHADSEGKVIKEDGEEKKEKVVKKVKKEETFEDDAEGEEGDGEPTIITGENDLPEDKKGGKLRIRMADGDLYNIDSQSTMPVKIDGKVEEVPVQELINNYSGKTAWDKKFTEIGKEKKTAKKKPALSSRILTFCIHPIRKLCYWNHGILHSSNRC